MTRRFADLSPAEVLGLAIDVEKNNAVRFSTVRDMFEVTEPEIRDLFDELRKEELEHLAVLEKTVATMFPEGVPAVSEHDVEEVVECVDVSDGEHAVFGDVTREQALRMALEAEVGAQDLYRRAAEATTDPELEKVYRMLLELETGHQQRIFDLLGEDES